MLVCQQAHRIGASTFSLTKAEFLTGFGVQLFDHALHLLCLKLQLMQYLCWPDKGAHLKRPIVRCCEVPKRHAKLAPQMMFL